MATITRTARDAQGAKGTLEIEWRRADGSVHREVTRNIVTQYGDQWYAEEAVGIGSHDAVTGMQLGTSGTAPAKTSTGANITSHLGGSNVEITATYPQSSLSSGKRRITWRGNWAAGEAEGTDVQEVALINASLATDSAAAVGATLARATFTPISPGSEDTVQITWHHDFGTVPE